MINITLPDNSVKQHNRGVTALDIAKSISEGLARNVLSAKVNGEVYDANRAINEDASLKLLTWKDKEGKSTMWHSSAHLMAEAIESLYPGVKFGIGPNIENGFYYDIDFGEYSISENDFKKIEDKILELARNKQTFTRRNISKAEAIEYFTKKDDKYKLELISELEDGEISFYESGNFVDLCRGPHLPDTSQIKAIKLLKIAGAYWRGDEKRKQLTRIYGITFPKKKELIEYLELLEEAKKRDHRKLGKELDFFSISEQVGGGLALWHPKGAMIRNIIETFWREEHYKNDYDLLFTPHIGRSGLWETSGHLNFYKDAMYAPMEIDGNDYYVKPMNCPFHIEVYQSRLRSYRELPLRWAELGTVYRYEKSGVLHGLLRVRGFTQDDAHIICTPEQIESEISEVLRFSLAIWKSFGFTDIKAYLATRPEKSVGEPERWEQALQSLEKAVKEHDLECEVDVGGGAFYGPKIDLKIKDALGREWQMTTIQFDFNLPERFGMSYIGEDGRKHQPYMVHRALLGSLERFFGILIEHYSGAFPLWLAPEQARILPIAERHQEYALEAQKTLKRLGLRIHTDCRSETIGSKIKDARNTRIPYILVAGDREVESGGFSVRSRREGQIGELSLELLTEKLLNDIDKKL